MRKWIIGTLAIAVGVLAYSAGPFLGLVGLAEAVQSRNAQAVIDRVDVASVRRSLLIQLVGEEASATVERIIEKDANPEMRELAERLAASAMQAALDQASADVLTPAVIVGVLSEGWVDGSGPSGFNLPDRPLEHLHGARFMGVNRFAFDIGQTNLPEEWSRITMRRDGLSWILHDIRLPQRVVAGLRPVFKTKIEQALGA